MSRTYAILEISQAAFDEIRGKLIEAGYCDQVDDVEGTVDMHGIAVKAEEASVPNPDIGVGEET